MTSPDEHDGAPGPRPAAPERDDARCGGFGDVIATYGELEPDGTDTWNPLNRDRELEYRVAAYRHLCIALRKYSGDRTKMRILDVGCGNGRSTRVFLDFGFGPDQLQGIDLRAGAIAMARASHSGIRFVAYDGSRLPMDDGSLDWVSLSTVMSSIPTADARRHMARECSRVLAGGGFLFYFDSLGAHPSARARLGAPATLFPELMEVSDQQLSLDRRPAHAGTKVRFVSRVRGLFTPIPTHRATLLQKRVLPGP